MPYAKQEVEHSAMHFLGRIAVWSSSAFADDALASRLMRLDARAVEPVMHSPALERSRVLANRAGQQRVSHYLVEIAGALADFAWEGVWNGSKVDLDNCMAEALLIEHTLSNREAFDLPSGEELFGRHDEVMQPLWLAQQAAMARYSILEDENIDVVGLAALAGLSEKTIRMAANPRNVDALVTTTQGRYTVVQPDDAMAWLRRRADFKETRILDGQLPETDFSTVSNAGVSLKMLRNAVDQSVADVSGTARLTHAESDELERLERGEMDAASTLYSFETLQKLAKVLQPDKPADLVIGVSGLALHAAAENEVARRRTLAMVES